MPLAVVAAVSSSRPVTRRRPTSRSYWAPIRALQPVSGSAAARRGHPDLQVRCRQPAGHERQRSVTPSATRRDLRERDERRSRATCRSPALRRGCRAQAPPGARAAARAAPASQPSIDALSLTVARRAGRRRAPNPVAVDDVVQPRVDGGPVPGRDAVAHCGGRGSARRLRPASMPECCAAVAVRPPPAAIRIARRSGAAPESRQLAVRSGLLPLARRHSPERDRSVPGRRGSPRAPAGGGERRCRDAGASPVRGEVMVAGGLPACPSRVSSGPTWEPGLAGGRPVEHGARGRHPGRPRLGSRDHRRPIAGGPPEPPGVREPPGRSRAAAGRPAPGSARPPAPPSPVRDGRPHAGVRPQLVLEPVPHELPSPAHLLCAPPLLELAGGLHPVLVLDQLRPDRVDPRAGQAGTGQTARPSRRPCARAASGSHPPAHGPPCARPPHPGRPPC